jgi:outer membrane receptor protein involved in Fe transport
VRTPFVSAQAEEKVTSKELARLGFFEDFEELDLEALLQSEVVTTTVSALGDRPVNRSPGSVVVVSSEQIHNLGARNLTDVLRTLPGVEVLLDGLGRERVILRGASSGFTAGASSSVLILLDGARLNEDLTGGATVINREIPIEHVKQIELIRGGASGLFGSGALAGVINIVTYRTGDFTGAELSVAGGSFGTGRVSLRLGNTIKGVSIAGFVQFLDTSGPRLPVPADAQTLADRGAAPEITPVSLAPGRTTDDYRLVETDYRVEFKGLTLRFRAKTENAGGFIGLLDSLGRQNDLNNSQVLVRASYRREVNPSVSVSGTIGFTQNKISDLLEAFPPGFTVPIVDGFTQFPSGVLFQTALNSRRYRATAAVEWTKPEHRLMVRLSRERESTFGLEASGNADFRTLTPIGDQGLTELPGVVADVSRDVTSAAVEETWNASPRVAVTGGLRLDHFSDIGDQVSPRAAVVLDLPHGIGMKLVYGHGFRAPSFSERTFNLPGFTGNPDLEPTTVDSFEAALSYERGPLSVGVSGFASSYRHTITGGGLAAPGEPRVLANTAGADVRGLELQGKRSFGAHSVFAGYTYQRVEDPASGERLADAAAQIATLGANLTFRDRFTVTPAWSFRGRLPRGPGDPRPEVASRGLLSLTVRARRLFRTLEIWGAVYNLFDESYVDPSPPGGVPGDYPRPGRSAFINASYRF